MKKLLLLDDDYRNEKLIRRKCKRDFEITWVKNETELEAEINAEFDVIVADVRIKGTDKRGHIMMEDIRMGFGFTGINIIVYSGVANISDIEKAFSGLFFDCIDKGSVNWTTIILETCIKASNEDTKKTSHRYLKNKLKKVGKENEPLENFDTIGGIFENNKKLKTLGNLVDLLLEDIGDEEIEYLERFLMDQIKKFETQQKLTSML
jgi:CheY-like chemotaxis protein